MSRLHVDWTRCDGRGLCVELLPETLDRDEWGYPVSVRGEREPGIDASAHGRAKRAVKACPRLALSIVDTDRR